MAKGNGAEFPQGHALLELEVKEAPIMGSGEPDFMVYLNGLWWKILNIFENGIAIVQDKNKNKASVRIKIPESREE